MLFSLPLLLLSMGSGPRITAVTCSKPPQKNRKRHKQNGRQDLTHQILWNWNSHDRSPLLLITVFISPGATSHNPHQPANLTWVIYNPETGEVLNSSSSMTPKGTWWPVLTFDLCVLAADGNGFGPHQLTKFFAHSSFSLFTRNWAKRPTVLWTGACLCLPGGRKGSEPNWKMWGSWLFLLCHLGLWNHGNSPLAH